MASQCRAATFGSTRRSDVRRYACRNRWMPQQRVPADRIRRRPTSFGQPSTHEYTTVFDADSLTEIVDFKGVERSPGRVRIATAVWFGDVRLIDNRDLFDD